MNHTRSALLILSVILIFAVAPKVYAECESNCDAKTDEGISWQFDVGLALSYQAGIVDSIEDAEGRLGATILLAGGVYYDNFFLESAPLSQHPLTVGYTVSASNDYRINLVAESWFSTIDPAESVDDSLDGISKRNGSLEIGVEYERAYTHYDLRVRVLHDALSRHKGSIATVELSRPIFFRTALLIPSVGLTFISQQAADFYYGIDEDETRAARPEYKAGSALVSSVRLYAERPMSKTWSIVGYAGYALLSSAISDSPIVSPRSDTYNVGLGVLWTF